MRSQSLIVAAATAAALIITASPAQAATRPGGDLVGASLIRQHACKPGDLPGGNGWLLDDAGTPRRELIYRDIDHAMNGGTRHLVIVFTCYRRH